MRDLVDAFIQEKLAGFARLRRGTPPAPPAEREDLRDGEDWYCADEGSLQVWFRGLSAAALQPVRLSRSPLWCQREQGEPQPFTEPDQLLDAILNGDGASGDSTPAGGPRTIADLRASVEHAEISLRAHHESGRPAPTPGGLLAGERLAATRDRPFHPTARASSGWTAAEHAEFGPMRRDPVAVSWVAVRRDRLRTGAGVGSDRLHEGLVDAVGQERLLGMMERAGVLSVDYQPLPVHPWQAVHVLPDRFSEEFASGEVVALEGAVGQFLPTASLRTLVTVPETRVHLKLPLGVSTLGATRLLPPRYLDNSDRAQRTMTRVIEGDTVLGRLVRVCDESVWSGWQLPSGEDEFADRPGHLAAQLRRFPEGLLSDPTRLVMPMGALASHEWDVLAGSFAELGLADGDRKEWALALFADIAGAFCRMGLSFLRYGVLPELHGQNVLAVFTAKGTEGFVLRDHDALRLHPASMTEAGIPEPGYCLKPGAPQSLSLPTPEALLGYLQTLGFQVNLFGIADALTRWSGVPEAAFWRALDTGVRAALDELDLPSALAETVEREVLRSRTWPSRQILGPLLQQAPRGDVSMPAGSGLVPNPLIETGEFR
ncbi:IucA/IucC family protein [Streptomyces sp. NPDC059255]|uniref:IucA/IucC family protein n=1 Tax=Streptomyces sp. NPDC059255 TaxID=3346793 RepID=UPI0036BAE353